jgi:hypothetical protein
MNYINVEDQFSGLINDYLNQIKYDSPNRKHVHETILKNLVSQRTQISEVGEISDVSGQQPSQIFDPDLHLLKLRKKAEEIATWNNPYDILVWLWAETTLKLELGYNPSFEKIVDLAKEFASKEKDVQKIHWYLAENLLKIRLS